MAKITKANGPTHDYQAAYPVQGVTIDSEPVDNAAGATESPEQSAEETKQVTPAVTPPTAKKTVSGKASVNLPGLKAGNNNG